MVLLLCWKVLFFMKFMVYLFLFNMGDGLVYMDEFVYFFVDCYGNVVVVNGIKGYSFDNELDFWLYIYVCMYLGVLICVELVMCLIEFVKVVKCVDLVVEMIGFVSYGFNGYYSF